jgi:phage/plasmid-associated DNA primase
MERLNELFQYIECAGRLGLIVIPLKGKKPSLKDWTKTTKDNEFENIKNCITGGRSNNIGILCGKTSGVVVVDVDTKDEGIETWNSLISQYGDPKTLKVITGSGGLHYYFRYSDSNEMVRSMSKYTVYGKKVGIDVKTNGGQVVFPGSIHPDTSRYYEFAKDSLDHITEMPDWLLSILLESTNKIENKNSPNISHNLVLNPPYIYNYTQSSNSTPTSSSNSTPASTPILNSKSNKEYPPITRECLLDIVNSLKLSRAEFYDDWKRVVWAIKSISEDFYDIAEIFSKRTTKDNYDEKILKKIWKANIEKINAGWLLNRLKEDIGDEEYIKFKAKHGYKNKNKSQELLNKMIHIQENKYIAEYFIGTYGKDIKVVDSERGIIYMFNYTTKLWEQLTLGEFSVKMSKILERDIEHIQIQINAVINSSSDENQKTNYKNVLTATCQLLNKLAKRRFCTEVAGWICCVSTDYNFQDIINNNPSSKHLLPIKGDKVINLKDGKIYPRTKEMFFSKEIPVTYDPSVYNLDNNYHSQDVIRENINAYTEIKKMIDEMFLMKKDLISFVQKVFGYLLTGEVIEKLILIFYGPLGNNGKSTVLKFFSEILGPFCMEVSEGVVLMTAKGAANAHTSHLNCLRGIRFAKFTELPTGAKLNPKIIKQISGADSIYIRGMGKESDKNLNLPTKLTLCLNEQPKLPDGDKALWDRLCYIKFLAKFVESPNPLVPNQFKCNKNVMNKWTTDPIYIHAFLHFCVEGSVGYYQEEGLKVPKDFQDVKEDLLNDVDCYTKFVEERCIISPHDQTKFISSKEFFDDFKL